MPRTRDPRFAPDCTITFDGERVAARAGEPVAVALLAAGRTLLARSAKYHRPRGAFCLAGSCNQCLARVDGLPNQRTCKTPCRDGLVVETQNSLGKAERDLLGVVDRVYSRGLDHHHLMTWSRFANRAAVAVARQLAGLGRLPDRVVPLMSSAAEERVDVLVVGAGPAGLGSAEVLVARGRRVLLVDREVRVGGHLRCRLSLAGDPELDWADGVAASVRAAGGEVALGTVVVGLWTDGGVCALLLRYGPTPGVRLVRPERIVLATGTHAQPAAFEDSDLPGIFAARGLTAALADFGVVPGDKAVVLGGGAEAAATAARLADAGMAVIPLSADEPRRAIGRGGRISAIETAGGKRLACDTVAVATPRAPATELARLFGAPVEIDEETGIQRILAPADGRIAPGVWLAGEVLGTSGAAAAVSAGRRAAEAILAEVARG